MKRAAVVWLIAGTLTAAHGGEVKLAIPGNVEAPLLQPAAAAAPGALGAEILERASALGVPLSAIGRAIQSSASPAAASTGLQRLGLIKERELRFDTPSNVEASRGVLQTLWYEAQLAAPGPEIDASLPVPALVARVDGVAYHIHGVAHGQAIAPRAAATRRTVRLLARRGEALYTEQNLHIAYGFRYGRETLDHGVRLGRPALLVDLGGPAFRPAVVDWLIRAVGLLSKRRDQAGLSLFSVRAELLDAARRAWAAGLRDAGDYWRRLRALYTGRSDVRDLLRLELPMPLKLSDPDTLSRSRAMAEAISADARARGLTKVHILTGINHADEIAYFLKNPNAR